ncbi:MAG: hypothetical protein R3C11_00660 [Planctomycetaceae bacterium]
MHARIEGDILEDALIIPRDAIQNGQVFVASRKSVPRPPSPNLREEEEKTESQKNDEDNSEVTEQEEAKELPPVYAIEARAVEVKQTLQSLAVISSGIEPGESVVMSNLDVIYDGAKIEIFSRKDLSEEIKSQRVRVARELDTASNAPAETEPKESSLESPTPAPR